MIVLRLFAVLACLLVASSSFAAPLERISPRQKVYLLRGFTNVLSPGIDQLAEELRRQNVPNTITNHALYPAVAQEALDDCKSGRVSSIVLVGHSFGASAAIAIAEKLQQERVRVALIVTFDPVIKSAVPANVRHLQNFYLSNGAGRPVDQGERFRGQIKNVDLKSNADVGHISITTYPAVHKQVLRDILAAHTPCSGSR
ncbi:MAG: hypothetical protein HY852_25375 [Bradyrhizobium sp.]|uniref:hypothetical protein n=1 Tax=Bradyrhizobium sp. TaxID=376 RepID=UPI0025BB62B6|nr:hypothetical protein [Bradyrhizobium sp.]MBI5265139.1 hypothetical protein [Bradyrhizobium sp.]